MFPVKFGKMSLSITLKPQANRPKRPSALAAVEPPPSDAEQKTYVSQFEASDNHSHKQSTIKPIAPIPNNWRPNKRLKNLQSLPSQSNEDTSREFELDPASNAEAPPDGSINYGLNLREPPAGSVTGRTESMAEFEIRKLRDDLDKLPDDTGMDEFDDVPVEGFGAALLLGYGWKEGRGIGRNAKEDVKISEVTKRAGRGGLGFTGDMPEEKVTGNGNAGDSSGRKDVGKKKSEDRVVKKSSMVGKEVRIVHGRDMGLKGAVVELRSDGDLLVLRASKSGEKVKVRSADVVGVGSPEEEKFLRKLKELKVKEKDLVSKDRRDRNSSSKKSVETERGRTEKVNWLRNHIRVRIISKKLKGGKLFLKKGIVVDVVGPGVCDVSIDETKELIQGVDQELLETAVPRRGGPVLVLYGKHKGVYGNLMERDTEKEKGVVRDADTHELLNVKLEEIAEFVGDPSDIGY